MLTNAGRYIRFEGQTSDQEQSCLFFLGIIISFPVASGLKQGVYRAFPPGASCVIVVLQIIIIIIIIIVSVVILVNFYVSRLINASEHSFVHCFLERLYLL